MAAEIYQPVGTIQVKGFTHEEIQDLAVSPKQNPFRVGHIPLFSQVGIDSKNGHYPSNLIKVSPFHGRSYEFNTDIDETGTSVVWSDEYGNLYTMINTKGNNCTDPKVEKSDIAPSGFVFIGLQDGYSLRRVLKASEILRSHNIDTEVLIKVIEPTELPYEGTNLPIPELKKRMLERVWQENAPEESDEKNAGFFKKPTRSDIPKIAEALENTTFFITVRGLQVSERLVDLSRAKDADLITMLGYAFKFINMEEATKARKDKSYKPESFSTEKKKDIRRYFNDYLPKRLARNFAKMHRLGLVHRYPHTGNISTVGSFYDLDSVRGEPLGEKPIKNEDIANDLLIFLYGDDGIANIIKGLSFKEPVGFKGVVIINPEKFLSTFLKEYVEQMGWEGDIFVVGYIYCFLKAFGDKNREKLTSYYTHLVAKRMDIYDTVLTLIGETVEKNEINDSASAGVVKDRLRRRMQKKVIQKCQKAIGRDLAEGERFSAEAFSNYLILDLIGIFKKEVLLQKKAGKGKVSTIPLPLAYPKI